MKQRKGEVVKDASGECGAFAGIIGLAFSNRHLNQYVTLTYERLMRGHGHQIGASYRGSPDLAHAAPEVILPDPQEWQQRDLSGDLDNCRSSATFAIKIAHPIQ